MIPAIPACTIACWRLKVSMSPGFAIAPVVAPWREKKIQHKTYPHKDFSKTFRGRWDDVLNGYVKCHLFYLKLLLDRECCRNIGRKLCCYSNWCHCLAILSSNNLYLRRHSFCFCFFTCLQSYLISNCNFLNIFNKFYLIKAKIKCNSWTGHNLVESIKIFCTFYNRW